MTNYEEFLFSNTFASILQEVFSNKSSLNLKKAEKINFGLSNVIYKLYVIFEENKSTKQKQIIIKFYLGSNSDQRKLKEYAILHSLYKRGYNVPEPMLQAYYEPHSFLIMEFISDKSLDKVFKDLDFNESKKFFEIMIQFQIQIHNLPVKEIVKELESLNIQLESVDQVTSYLTNLHDLSKQAGFFEFERLFKWLQEHKPNKIIQKDSLVHNDFHATNMLLKNTTDMYFIDWEGISIGNPIIDACWTIFVTAGICGRESEEYLLESYNKKTNYQVTKTELEYYMVLCASWRMVVFTIILHDVQGVRANDSTYKDRIIQNYKEPILYFSGRIQEITSCSFPSLIKKIKD